MRSSLVVLSVLVLAAGACTAPPAPTEGKRTAPSTIYTMEQLMKTVSVGGGYFSSDETKLLVHTNETGVFNLYSIDLATGERAAITQGDETTFAVAYLPNDDRIFFRRDQGGNEVYHLYLRELDGTIRDLTQGEQTREMFIGYAHDLKSFFTLNNARDQRYMDLYEWDIEKLQPVLIYRNDQGLEPEGISNDKRWLALGKPNTTNDMDLYVQDLGGDADPILISAHEGIAAFSFEDFSVDSKYLYYTTNADGEFAQLRRYDLATGAHEDVLSSDWDVTFAYFSRNGKYRVVNTNEDGYTRVRITETATGQDLILPAEVAEGTVNRVLFARSERKLRFTLSSDTLPTNLFLYDIEAGQLEQLTDTLDPSINPDDLVASEVMRFTARDGLEIPGPLYKPIGAGPDNKVPMLVWVHGGPGGQSRPGYSAQRQLLLNHGYGIYAINNRGSSGYGKSFLAADDQRHGREPLWDCVDAKEHLAGLDWVDGDRIGIIGGSYGGYMVLAALAYEPEVFDVGVDIFGVANWVRTLKSIPPWWESFRLALYQEMGDPETQEQMLHDISPVFHADQIVRPLIILQGANDSRVLQAESDDMVRAIEEHGGLVEYLVFEDEGHGFTKTENRIEGWNAILAFLETHLKSQAVESAPAAATDEAGH